MFDSLARSRACGVVGVLMVAACCSGGSSGSAQCTGIITKDGKTYRAVTSGRDAERTKRQTCNEYCVQNDAACEPVYQQWLATPDGKVMRSSKSVAIYHESGKAILECITRTCADGCVQQIAAGTLDCKVTCP